MTVVIACRNNNHTIIAADSAVVAGEIKYSPPTNFSKLVKFKHFIVGFAGSCTAYTVLTDLSRDGNYCKRVYMKMRSIEDAKKFSEDFYAKLKDTLEISPGTPTNKEDDNCYVDLLIAAKTGLWECDPFMCIIEHSTFVTIGSGADLAYGAISALYKPTGDLWETVQKAMFITCQRHIECGQPFNIMEL